MKFGLALDFSTPVRTLDAIRHLELPSTVHAHIGIATGEMLVGAASGPTGAIAARGQALSLALQLQAAAPSDGVLVAQRTRELVGDLFDCRELEALVLAEDLPPVAVWQVAGERGALGGFVVSRRSAMVALVGRV